jgi:hypothetical protein
MGSLLKNEPLQSGIFCSAFHDLQGKNTWCFTWAPHCLNCYLHTDEAYNKHLFVIYFKLFRLCEFQNDYHVFWIKSESPPLKNGAQPLMISRCLLWAPYNLTVNFKRIKRENYFVLNELDIVLNQTDDFSMISFET